MCKYVSLQICKYLPAFYKFPCQAYMHYTIVNSSTTHIHSMFTRKYEMDWNLFLSVLYIQCALSLNLVYICTLACTLVKHEYICFKHFFIVPILIGTCWGYMIFTIFNIGDDLHASKARIANHSGVTEIVKCTRLL